MTKVRALIVAGNGTNCERETAFACHAAGADQADVVFLWDLIAGEVHLRDYNFLCLISNAREQKHCIISN